MFDIIPQITFFTSLAVVVFIFVRAASRVEHAEETARGRVRGALTRLTRKFPLEEIDRRLALFLEKLLRKTKVVILKTDNKVTAFLHHIRHTKPRIEDRSAHGDLPENGFFDDKEEH